MNVVNEGALSTRVAIVTGAGKGIGAEIARRFASEGAVVVVADVVESRAKKVAHEIDVYGQALPLLVDVSSRDSVFAMVESVVSRFAGVHILVNNAGICFFDVPLEDLSEEQWRRVLGVNLDGAFFCTQAVVPHMKRQRYGRIINISGLGGKIGSVAGTADYAASKGGVLGFTKWCARRLAQYGITVNAIVPGPIGGDTMAGDMPPEAIERTSKKVPLGRMGMPIDIANAAFFFASDLANWITGEVMDVNGGFYID